MKRKNKFISFAMCFALILTSLGWTGNDKAHAAVDESDFDVNTAWTLSNDITTIYSVNNADGERAYSLGTSKIGDYVVNVNLVKQKDRNDGATSLTKNGQNQAAYKATREMFYGNPDPSKIPALGIWTQASDGVGGPLGSWDKINFNGAEEVATLTFTFDKAVTDPILDLSGLGGYAYAAGTFDDINGHKSLVARGSFNGTDIELLTDGITLESLTGSNIVVDSKSINIKDRNTHSYSAEYPEKIVTHTDDDFGTQYSPKLTGSGAGSVKLKGTFNEVSFKLSHHAVPFSSFPKETYGTSDPYFANYGGKDNPRYGDGINGWNLMTSEKFYVGDFEMAQSNSDLFRVSLRLEKPSSIGDTVWFDKDADGIQGLGEQGLDGITVKLLDKDGNPAKDYNGKLVSDQVTSNGGKYKFENLAAGEYIVQVVPGESQKLTKESQGTDTEKDSNVNPETGKTAIISLEANTNLTDIDAGIVKEYKVDYEFQPSTVEGTPKELPQGVKDQLPAEKAGLADGTSVESPKGFTSVRDEVNKGTWSFEAWDQETATIQGADEHVVGTWVFTPDTYKVDYEFQPSTVEGTPKELPQGVKDQLPAEKAELADGTSVESPKGFTSVRDEVNKGTWSFEAWDQETATIQGADEHVVGTWVFTPDTYKVDYEFQPSTAEGTPKELPQGVKDQLPAEKAGLADGTSVESPKGFTSVRDEANKGTWSFEAWDQETATIQGADEHVVGTWVFTPDTIEPPIEEKGTVYVKYITEDGTILEDITVVKQDAPVGEAYTTEQKTFDGYVFSKMADGSADANGNVAAGEQTVVYVYKAKEDPKPPTEEKGTVYVKYITEDGTILEDITVVKQDAPVGEVYTTEEKTFDGYVFSKMADGSADANGNVAAGEQTVVYVYKAKEDPKPPTEEKGTVYVKYITEDGTILENIAVVKQDAPVGEAYTTEQKTFDGYVFSKMADGSADANGNVVEGEQTVVYVYKAKEDPKPPIEEKGTVYVKYITEDGTILENIAVVKQDAPVGEAYTTEQKTFDGYVFSKMADGSADANGDVAAGEQTVVYVYKAKEDPTKDVITKYVDEDGNILSRTEDGSKPKKDISGYEYVKTVVDKDGNTTHIYKKTNPVDSSKNVKSLSSPKTGDGLNGSTYAFVLLASGAILIAIGVKRKKEEV